MRSQAESLAASFKAAIMGEILSHRLQEHGRLYHVRPDGPVSPFLQAVEQHRARYAEKIAKLRNTETPKAAIDNAEKKIDEIMAQEVNRITATGIIEFA